jgi:hypothetical protein
MPLLVFSAAIIKGANGQDLQVTRPLFLRKRFTGGAA